MFRRRRFSNRRRTFRRRRPIQSRRLRSRRIYRRFVRRTALRPELKFFDRIQSAVGQAAGVVTNYEITPPQIPNGTGNGQRVGNQVKFTKLRYRYLIQDNSTINSLTAANTQSGIVRLVWWSPRVDYTVAADYMGTLGSSELIDYNYVTIYKDRLIHLSPPTQTISSTAPTLGGNSVYARQHMITGSMIFPRKVHFSPGAADVDEEKYGCFLTILTRELPIVSFLNTRTFYFDA